MIASPILVWNSTSNNKRTQSDGDAEGNIGKSSLTRQEKKNHHPQKTTKFLRKKIPMTTASSMCTRKFFFWEKKGVKKTQFHIFNQATEGNDFDSPFVSEIVTIRSNGNSRRVKRGINKTKVFKSSQNSMFSPLLKVVLIYPHYLETPRIQSLSYVYTTALSNCFLLL